MKPRDRCFQIPKRQELIKQVSSEHGTWYSEQVILQILGVGSSAGGEEIAEKFNNYLNFTSIGPSLAENIDSNECNYSQLVQ